MLHNYIIYNYASVYYKSTFYSTRNKHYFSKITTKCKHSLIVFIDIFKPNASVADDNGEQFLYVLHCFQFYPVINL